MVKQGVDGAPARPEGPPAAPAKAAARPPRLAKQPARGAASRPAPANRREAARATLSSTALGRLAMKLFLHAHATHPDWRIALALAAAQIEAQRARARRGARPTLGWVYLSDHYAERGRSAAGRTATSAGRGWPGSARWASGIAANGVEYFDEPALVLMLGDIPPADFRVFSGARPLAGSSARASTPHRAGARRPAHADLGELIAEMADRTGHRLPVRRPGECAQPQPAHRRRRVRGRPVGRRLQPRSGAVVARDPGLPAGRAGAPHHRRRTQPGRRRSTANPRSTACCATCSSKALEPREALPQLRETLVGLSDPQRRRLVPRRASSAPTRGCATWSASTRRGAAIAIGDEAETGMQLAFCTRNTEAARRDLVRICSEIREELEPDALPLETALALRGSEVGAARTRHGGSPAPSMSAARAAAGPTSAHHRPNWRVVRHALGDVPLVGFFAAGEIARHHLYGYTGVLTVFTA